MTARSPAVWPPPAKRMARSSTASLARSRARLAGWIMAYNRCKRVLAAASPRRHQAAASCCRRRSRTPAARALSAARRSARVIAGASGCNAAQRSVEAALASLPHRVSVPVQIIERPTTVPWSPVISMTSNPATSPGAGPAITAAPARRGPSPRSAASLSRQRHMLWLVPPTPIRDGSARFRSRMLPICRRSSSAADTGITVLVLRHAVAPRRLRPSRCSIRAGVHGRS